MQVKKTFVPTVALLFWAFACDMPGKCKVGDEADCPEDAFCYGGEKAKAGKEGICVHGELSSEGKPTAKIKAWRLLMRGETEALPLVWDEKDAAVPQAKAGWLGMAAATVEVEVVGLTADKALKAWTGHGAEAACKPPAERKLAGEVWECSFKEGWAASLEEDKAETVEVRVQAGEADARWRTYRVLCNGKAPGLASGMVASPLAMSGKRLLFGTGSGNAPGAPADNSLFVFDTATCAWVGSPLHTGAVQGPMVVLNDTGRVAVATGAHGPAGREGQRLSLVNVSRETPHFYDKADCVRDAQSGVVFQHGLSLLSLPEVHWRLVAPANNPSANKAQFIAYTPEVAPSEHCVGATIAASSLFEIPASQLADGMLIGVYNAPSQTFVQRGRFDGTVWNLFYPAQSITLLKTVFPLAVIDEPFLQGGDEGIASPAVADSQGRTYYVVRPPGSDDSHLYRRADNILEGMYSSPFEGPSVGSPLLGEPLPGGEAQVYVVTTQGKVLAYGMELGAPLWTHNLGIDIAPTAQPVLSGDTLWVVGKLGEVRGIRVSSQGLSREAYWPKAFRDNCNTSSRLSTPSSMPSCF